MSSEFFKRWSDRKQHAYIEKNASETEETLVSDNVTPPEVECVQDDEHVDERQSECQPTSVAALLKDVKADKALKKAALRKLFLQPEFNVVDGLNDYDHDYSAVKALTLDVAQTLRDWVNDDNQDEHSKLSQQTQNPQSPAEALSADLDESSVPECEIEPTLNDSTPEQHELNQTEKGVQR